MSEARCRGCGEVYRQHPRHPPGQCQACLRRHLPLVPPPPTRADCVNGPRPCVCTGCRHHMSGAASCALDVADRGPLGVEDVAAAMGVSRAMVWHLERTALARVAAALHEPDPSAR